MASQPLFFHLPREIRDLIYGYLLATNNIINMRRIQAIDEDRETANKLGLSTAILRVCHQSCEEGLTVLYGVNAFITVVSSAYPASWILDRLVTLDTVLPPGDVASLGRVPRDASHPNSVPHPNLSLIRYLWVDLRALSYSQFIKWAFFLRDDDSALQQRITTQLAAGILELDVLSIWVDRPALILDFEPVERAKASLYPLWAESWHQHARTDLRSIRTWIHRYGTRLAKRVIIHENQDQSRRDVRDGDEKGARNRPQADAEEACLKHFAKACVMDPISYIRVIDTAQKNGDVLVSWGCPSR
jgi:hypothetical protein